MYNGNKNFKWKPKKILIYFSYTVFGVGRFSTLLWSYSWFITLYGKKERGEGVSKIPRIKSMQFVQIRDVTFLLKVLIGLGL